MIFMKTSYIIEESFSSGETTIIKKVQTIEEVHKIIAEVTNNNYIMDDYKINSFAKIIHYLTPDRQRYFNVHVIEE